MKPELFAQVKALDPTPLDAEMPAGAWSEAVVLQEIERRIGMETKDTTREAAPLDVTQVRKPSGTEEPLVEATDLDRPVVQRIRRNWVPVLAAAVIVLVVGAALAVVSLSSGGDEVIDDPPVTTTAAPPETTTTVAADVLSVPVRLGNIQGLWYSVETESYVRNNSDGTYEVAEDRLGLDSNTFLQGRFELDGDTLTLISSAASQVCDEGATGQYRIEIIDAGHNRTTLIDDECEVRGATAVINYQRPAPRPSDILGTWYGVEPRAYTRNNPDGTYVGAENMLGLESNPPLQGQYQLNGDILTIIASAASQVCEEGDTGHRRIEIIDTDRWTSSFIDDECAFRREWAIVTNQPSP